MLCYSTGSLPSVSLAEIAGILKPTVFKGLEVVVLPQWLPHCSEAALWTSARKSIEMNGLSIRNVHLGAPLLASQVPHEPGLASLVSSGRKAKLECVLKCVQIASYFHSPFITITTGPMHKIRSLPEHIDNLHLSIQYILDHLPPNMKLALEQEPEHVIHSTPQMSELCRCFEGRLFLTFDLGHAAVLGENIPDSLRELLPYIVNLHFEDIRGRVHKHELFGDGDMDFKSISRALRDLAYRGDYTPDLYPFAEDYLSALAASERFFRETGIPV